MNINIKSADGKATACLCGEIDHHNAKEIREELDAEITVGTLLETVDWDYPAFHLTMHCILCTIVSGKLELLEHENAAWLTKENLRTVKWLPADELILDKVAMFLQSKNS